jgi:hypothetical protein
MDSNILLTAAMSAYDAEDQARDNEARRQKKTKIDLHKNDLCNRPYPYCRCTIQESTLDILVPKYVRDYTVNTLLDNWFLVGLGLFTVSIPVLHYSMRATINVLHKYQRYILWPAAVYGSFRMSTAGYYDISRYFSYRLSDAEKKKRIEEEERARKYWPSNKEL